MNTLMKGQEASYILQKSGARVLFCAGHFLGQHFPTLLAQHWPKTLEHAIVIGETMAKDLGWRAFMARADGEKTEHVLERAAAVRP
ncbi:MAG: fatty acid--CoA ligase, partial [Hydrocarboniphaga effusa]|nr:fatty acid--CoA ligase [Hydrocarboniphaga effusa]